MKGCRVVLISMLALASVQVSAAAAAAAACDSAYTQADLNECTVIELAAEDRQLNSSYRTLRQFLDNNEKTQLKLAQLAWINFKDKACDFSTRHLSGGSAYRMEYHGCMTKYTCQRRMELDEEVSRLQ